MSNGQESFFQKVVSIFQEPIPQYVLGSLPAIATIGAAPDNGLRNKLLWILRCLGSPFTGLFYFCNIGNDEIAMSTYWLTSRSFNGSGKAISYRPFGHHAKKLLPTEQQTTAMKECIAEASVLDRLSSIISAYYIFVGIFAGIAGALGPCVHEDWPNIPLALAWTLPAIYNRVAGGKMVFIDPRQRIRDTISVKKFDPEDNDNKNHIDTHVVLTFVFSIVTPWISVLLAFHTKPVGFFCRSIYLTVLCLIWTFNSTIAYVSHIKGEKNVSGSKYINALFSLSGVVVAVLLILLGLLSKEQKWWVDLFGGLCDKHCP